MEPRPRHRGILRSGEFGLVPWDSRGFNVGAGVDPIVMQGPPPKDSALFEDFLEDCLRTGMYSYGLRSDTEQVRDRWHRLALRPRVRSVPMHEVLSLRGEEPGGLRDFWTSVVKDNAEEAEAVMAAGRALQKRWLNGYRSGRRTLLESAIGLIEDEDQVRAFAQTALARTLQSNLLSILTHDARANVQANHVACVVLLALQWHGVEEVESVLYQIGEHDLHISGVGLIRLLDLRASDPALKSTPVDLLATIA